MAIHNERRQFIFALGGAAAAWPLTARAQQPKVPTIGFLGQISPSAEGLRLVALVQRLRELGWIEDRNVAIAVRWAEGRPERYSEIAAEFIRLKVDVIVTGGTQSVLALKQATSIIPIVFATVADPVGIGLVASLARPGGNITGHLGSKRLDLLREVVPGLRRLAILTNIDSPAAVLERNEVQAAASAFGLKVDAFDIRRTEDIAPAFEAFKGEADALYLVNEPLVNFNRVRINTLALGARLPTMHSNRRTSNLAA
jgi:putative ABC transport system substrate-binding protein